MPAARWVAGQLSKPVSSVAKGASTQTCKTTASPDRPAQQQCCTALQAAPASPHKRLLTCTALQHQGAVALPVEGGGRLARQLRRECNGECRGSWRGWGPRRGAGRWRARRAGRWRARRGAGRWGPRRWGALLRRRWGALRGRRRPWGRGANQAWDRHIQPQRDARVIWAERRHQEIEPYVLFQRNGGQEGAGSVRAAVCRHGEEGVGQRQWVRGTSPHSKETASNSRQLEGRRRPWHRCLSARSACSQTAAIIISKYHPNSSHGDPPSLYVTHSHCPLAGLAVRSTAITVSPARQCDRRGALAGGQACTWRAVGCTCSRQEAPRCPALAHATRNTPLVHTAGL